MKFLNAFLLSALLMFTGVAGSAMAGKKPRVVNARAIIKLFDATASVPVPPWQKTTATKKESNIARARNKTVFLLEFIPKREKFKSWSRMYAIRAEKNPGLSLATAYKAQVSAYVKACGLKNLKQQILKRDKSRILFLLLCPKSPNGPKKFGYGRNTGQISVFWMAKYKSTVIRVYQHWRGKRFDPKNQKTWPVSKKQMKRVISRFAAISLK